MVLNTEVKKLIFSKLPMAVALTLAVSALNVKVLNPKLVGRGSNFVIMSSPNDSDVHQSSRTTDWNLETLKWIVRVSLSVQFKRLFTIY